VSSVLVGNAVAWYDNTGNPEPRPPVPGEAAQASTGRGGYTPYGLAFAPDGILYFADIHIACSSSGCGPATNEGQILKVTFTQPGSIPSAPTAVNTEPLNFPVSVTACTPSPTTVCPAPPGQ
jgi:hypothetical protein